MRWRSCSQTSRKITYRQELPSTRKGSQSFQLTKSSWYASVSFQFCGWEPRWGNILLDVCPKRYDTGRGISGFEHWRYECMRVSISSGQPFSVLVRSWSRKFSGRGRRLVALVLVQVEAFMLGEDILTLILLCYNLNSA